jgi:hypothetical protein
MKAVDEYEHVRAIDPTGSDLARLAEVGQAVERLLDKRDWFIEPRRLDDGTVGVRVMVNNSAGRGPTLPAAIAAALGEEP